MLTDITALITVLIDVTLRRA